MKSIGGHSSFHLAAGRAGRAIPSMPLRISAQNELQPIKPLQSGFDARDFATNSFVILFFGLVFFAPLVVLGAVVFRLK